MYGKNDTLAINNLLEDALNIACSEEKNKFLDTYSKDSMDREYLARAMYMRININEYLRMENIYLMYYSLNKNSKYISSPSDLKDFEVERLMKSYIDEVVLKEEENYKR